MCHKFPMMTSWASQVKVYNCDKGSKIVSLMCSGAGEGEHSTKQCCLRKLVSFLQRDV